ncbi:hypothetical protein DSOL_5262 [Desulfosporosinus metallidurans]|uniref:Uncharacterized protein n=1 Tax=Desulfosporosinus metallidurans TaxID=1888891 RepID=A0A1Q8QEH1_9FIRM|nr:hypothetical protein DSOL_5262 [Desulfosporosinus metallidurans]
MIGHGIGVFVHKSFAYKFICDVSVISEENFAFSVNALFYSFFDI